jgi:hypothetical protein
MQMHVAVPMQPRWTTIAGHDVHFLLIACRHHHYIFQNAGGSFARDSRQFKRMPMQMQRTGFIPLVVAAKAMAMVGPGLLLQRSRCEHAFTTPPRSDQSTRTLDACSADSESPRENLDTSRHRTACSAPYVSDRGRRRAHRSVYIAVRRRAR